MAKKAGQAWNEPQAKDKVVPRVCVANSRDALQRAWETQDSELAVHYMLSAVDWMRRALEQMNAPGGSHEILSRKA